MCDFKNHNLKEIYSTSSGWNEDHVVKWCRDCGAVMIELQSDNRVFKRRGYLPKLVKEKYDELYAEKEN